MAEEKIIIAKLDLDVSKVLKETEKTKKEIDKLVISQKELKKSGDTSSQTFIENEAQLKSLRKEYNDQIKVVQAMSGGVGKLESELNKEINSIKQAKDQNQALRRIRDELNVDTEEGQKLLKQLNDRIDQNTDFTKENTDAISKQKNNVGNYTESINKAKIGVKAFGGALKAAGIGLAVAAFAALSNALGKNERVMLAVNTVMNALASVFQPLLSSLIDGVQAAYQATGGFDAMGKVISSLMTLALTPLQLAFYAIKDAVLSAQLGWEKSIFGSGDKGKIASLTADIEQTRGKVKELGDEAIEAGKTLYSSMGEAVGEVGAAFTSMGEKAGAVIDGLREKGISGIFGDAKQLAQFEQQLERLEAKQQEIQLQYQKRAEILRQTRDDETASIQERTEANNKLQALLKEQEAAEKAIVQQKIEGYQQMLAINKDDLEAKNALAEANNELIDIEERLTGQLSEALTNRNSLRNEGLETVKASGDAEIALEEDKLKRIEELKKQFRDKEKEQGELDSQAKIDKHYSDLESEIQLMVEEDTLKREMLRNLRLQWDEETTEYQAAKKEAENQKKQEELEAFVAVEKAKIDSKRKAIDSIAGLFGEETAVAKGALMAKQILAMQEFLIDQGLFQSKQAMAIGETTMATTTGMATTASVGFPWNIPLIAGFIGQTAGLISTIKSVVAPKKPNLPKAAKGATLQGPSHAQGGITLYDENGRPVVEAEGGENIYVLNKRASQLGWLDELNQATGGVPLTQATTYAAAGGMIQNTTTAGPRGSSQSVDYELMAAKIAEANRSLPAPRVAIDEINNGQGQYAEVVNGAIF